MVKSAFLNLPDDFDHHACLSLCVSILACMGLSIIIYDIQFLQVYHKVRPIKVAWCSLRVKNMHIGAASDPPGLRGKGKLSYILDNIRRSQATFIKTYSSFLLPPPVLDTPTMHPQSRYLLVHNNFLNNNFLYINLKPKLPHVVVQ